MQKSAYEMRISDWSSDVCSSDLLSLWKCRPAFSARRTGLRHAQPERIFWIRGMIQLAAFYLFATIVIASAAMVILARNPVHSVMWPILAFFNAAGLMLLAGAEFIALLLVLVYVRVVAVLFLVVALILAFDFAGFL